MASGKPRLAAWSDNTLRIYEMGAAGFVQIGTGGLNVDPAMILDGQYPELFFVRDSAYVVGIDRPTNNSGRVGRTYRADGSIAATSGLGNQARSSAFSSTRDDGILFGTFGSSTAGDLGSNRLGAFRIAADGALSSAASANSGVRNMDVASVSISPDGALAIYGSAAGYTSRRIVPSDVTWGIIASDTPINHQYPMTAQAWNHAGDFLYAADATTSRKVHVFRRTGSDLEPVASFGSEPGIPISVRVSRDNRHVAVAWRDGSSYSTAVYRRTGIYYQRVQLIANFGRLLDFSADGQLLIDASAKKCRRMVGAQFEAADDLMSAVASGVFAQAVSTHFEGFGGFGQLYNGSVPALVGEAADLSALKLSLLSADAVFTPTHSSISQVTANGSLEVTGSGWPVGGRALLNVHPVEIGANTVRYIADGISHLVIEASMSFRYGVVYDTTSNKPLLFIDFQREIVALMNRELVMSFEEAGLFQFTT